MQPRDPFLYNLCYGHGLADSLSHCLKNNFSHLFILKEAACVANIVPNEALSGDSDFVLAYDRFRPRLRHSLISIHGSGAAPSLTFLLLLMQPLKRTTEETIRSPSELGFRQGKRRRAKTPERTGAVGNEKQESQERSRKG